MRLVLHNVLKYEDSTFDFPDYQLTLLTGPSGVGKTSLLKAISWLLYETPSVTPRKRHGQKSLETWVRLELADGVLERQKCLMFYPKGQSNFLRGEAAQSWVESHFGPRELWFTTGYLTQWSLSPLLSGTNAGKMESLRMLTFEVPPDDFIQEIRQAGEDYEKTYQRETARVDALRELLHQDLARYGISDEDVALDHQLNFLEKEMERLDAEIKTTRSRVQAHRHAISTRLSLLQTRKSLEDQLLIDLPEDSPGEIERLDSQLVTLRSHVERYQRYQQRVNEINAIRQKLQSVEARLPVALRSPPEQLDQLYQRTLVTEELIERERGKYAKMGLPYEPKSAEKRQDKIKGLLANETEINLARDWKGLCWEFERLGLKPGTDSPFESEVKLRSRLVALEEQLRLQQLSRGVQTCPKCSQPLRLVEGKLVVSEHPPASSQDITENERRLVQLRATIDKARRFESLIPRLRSLQEQLEKASMVNPDGFIVPQPPPDFNQLKLEMERLGGLQYHASPEHTSAELKLALEAQTIRKRLAEQEVPLVPVEPPKDSLDALARRREELIRLRERRATLERQLADLKQRLMETQSDPDAENELARLSIQKQELTKQLAKAKRVRLLLDRSEAIDREAEMLKQSEQELLGYQRLHDLARSIEGEMIEEVTHRLSLMTNSILARLFDVPITVTLSPFRTTKQGLVRMTVSIKIDFQGAELTNGRELSGGEEVRVSLALTFALAAISPGRFLLLDESLKGLDTETILAAIGALRETVRHKTLILILHDGIEGWFDHTLSLS